MTSRIKSHSFLREGSKSPSYHDVTIETSLLKQTPISLLPFGYELACTRSSGWVLTRDGSVVASEYPEIGMSGLRVTVNWFVVVDSLTESERRK